MRKVLSTIIFICLFIGFIVPSGVLASEFPSPRFDGLYCAYNSEESILEAIRFYEDDRVIVGLFGKGIYPKEASFRAGTPVYAVGNYTMNEKKMFFIIDNQNREFSPDDSYSEWDGVLNGDTLMMNIYYSNTNMTIVNREYFFIPWEKISSDGFFTYIRNKSTNENAGKTIEGRINPEEIHTETEATVSTETEEPDYAEKEKNTEELIEYNVPARAVRSITIKNDILYLGIKKQLKLQADVNRLSEDAPKKTELEWHSLNEDIATVSKQGVVKGISVGTARIECKMKDDPDNYAIITVQVLNQIQNIKSEAKKIILFEGQEEIWNINIIPEDASIKELKYSSNSEIITVDSNGTVSALRTGKGKITAEATDGSGKKVSIEVVVEPIVPINVVQSGYSKDDSDLFWIKVKSDCLTKTIVNFVFDVNFYDFNGNKVNSNLGIMFEKNMSIGPGKSRKISMSMFGALQAYRKEVMIKKVYFSDGTEWEIPKERLLVWSTKRK